VGNKKAAKELNICLSEYAIKCRMSYWGRPQDVQGPTSCHEMSVMTCCTIGNHMSALMRKLSRAILSFIQWMVYTQYIMQIAY